MKTCNGAAAWCGCAAPRSQTCRWVRESVYHSFGRRSKRGSGGHRRDVFQFLVMRRRAMPSETLSKSEHFPRSPFLPPSLLPPNPSSCALLTHLPESQRTAKTAVLYHCQKKVKACPRRHRSQSNSALRRKPAAFLRNGDVKPPLTCRTNHHTGSSCMSGGPPSWSSSEQYVEPPSHVVCTVFKTSDSLQSSCTAHTRPNGPRDTFIQLPLTSKQVPVSYACDVLVPFFLVQAGGLWPTNHHQPPPTTTNHHQPPPTTTNEPTNQRTNQTQPHPANQRTNQPTNDQQSTINNQQSTNNQQPTTNTGPQTPSLVFLHSICLYQRFILILFLVFLLLCFFLCRHLCSRFLWFLKFCFVRRKVM